MNWFTNTFGTSIGKKLMMSCTGLAFCGFLAVHLAGNLTLYGGADLFNAYAEHLHSLGPLLTVAEFGMLAFACIHILSALVLYLENLKARPTRYAVNKNAGGRTIGSSTMPYTGLILIGFITLHLINFHFVDKTDRTIFEIVSAALSNPGLALAYVAAMIVAAIHVSHGFWSAFQTLGANHPKYMPIIKKAGLIFSLLIAVGFGFIPVYFSIIS
ncbi:MAG: succinate dehydrogenase cytochrome b subunit [Desulfobacterales bacterium]|nr:succinate dehydrogenase cytochrome b subunit [Desulfobacterales bacterium]